MRGYVYSISEKITNRILYIGSSICPDNRLQSHKVDARKGNSPFYEYLLMNKIEFYMDIVEEVEIYNKKDQPFINLLQIFKKLNNENSMKYL